VSSNSFMRRLEALERKIGFRRPRQITILVDGDSEDQSAPPATKRMAIVLPVKNPPASLLTKSTMWASRKWLIVRPKRIIANFLRIDALSLGFVRAPSVTRCSLITET
jgi:hypothetical protein